MPVIVDKLRKTAETSSMPPPVFGIRYSDSTMNTGSFSLSHENAAFFAQFRVGIKTERNVLFAVKRTLNTPVLQKLGRRFGRQKTLQRRSSAFAAGSTFAFARKRAQRSARKGKKKRAQYGLCFRFVNEHLYIKPSLVYINLHPRFWFQCRRYHLKSCG